MPGLLLALTSSMSGSRGGSPVHTFSTPDFVGGYGGQVSSHSSVLSMMLLNSVQIFMLSVKHAAPPPSSSCVSARLLSAMHTACMAWQIILRHRAQRAVPLKQTEWPSGFAGCEPRSFCCTLHAYAWIATTSDAMMWARLAGRCSALPLCPWPNELHLLSNIDLPTCN